MEIRLFRKSDLNKGFMDCLKVLGEIYSESSDISQILKHRSKCGIKTFVVECDNRIVATASLLLESKFRYKEKCGHIEDVCVAEDFQRKGIGKILLDYVILQAKRETCYKLVLSTDQKNIGFYKNLGFFQHELNFRLDLRK